MLAKWICTGVLSALLFGATAMAQLPCVGDCNGDGMVAINELIIGVNIALGNRPVGDCPSFDSNNNGLVAVNELVQAVNAALQGCSGTVPTPTPTQVVPDPDIETVAGASAAVANALSGIANVIGAVAAGVAGSATTLSLAELDGGGAGSLPDPCELGGTVRSDIRTVGVTANVTVLFDDCEVSRPGGSVRFDGLLEVLGLNLSFRGNGTFGATIEFKDDAGEVIARTTANIASPVVLSVAPGTGNPCGVNFPVLGRQVITGVDMTNLTGTLSSQVPGEGTAVVEFLGTMVELDIDESDDDCVPLVFDLLFNGPSRVTQETPAATVEFALRYVAFLLSATRSGDESLVSMSGDLVADCLGGTAKLSTPQNLSFLLGRYCPGAGTLSVQDVGEIVFSIEGVTVGELSFDSCLDPELLMCVE